jgi:hypothetical protein
MTYKEFVRKTGIKDYTEYMYRKTHNEPSNVYGKPSDRYNDYIKTETTKTYRNRRMLERDERIKKYRDTIENGDWHMIVRMDMIHEAYTEYIECKW